MSEPVSVSLTLVLKIGIMAIVSGIAGALNRHMQGKDSGWKDTVIIAIVYAICGLIFGLIAKTLTNNEYLILALTGASGFLGAKAMGSLLKRWVESTIK